MTSRLKIPAVTYECDYKELIDYLKEIVEDEIKGSKRKWIKDSNLKIQYELFISILNHNSPGRIGNQKPYPKTVASILQKFGYRIVWRNVYSIYQDEKLIHERVDYHLLGRLARKEARKNINDTYENWIQNNQIKITPSGLGEIINYRKGRQAHPEYATRLLSIWGYTIESEKLYQVWKES